MITLTLGASTVQLSDHLVWVDEFLWNPVSQRSEYSITGALIVETASRQAGRPITLRGGADHGWMPRSAISALRGFASQTNAQMVLNLRGTTYDVIWDHANVGFEAIPVVDYADPLASDYYTVVLRLIEV